VPGGRILVAGSSVEAAKEVRDTLAGDGYQIRVARDSQLPQLIAQQRPHLLILTGARSEGALLETVQRARRQAWGASLPILVLAGSEGPGAAGRLVDACTDVLSRPLNPAFLRPRVRAWLSRVGTSAPGRRQQPTPRMVNAAIAPGRGLLTGLPLAERAALLTRAQTARFRLGEIIFKQGEPAGGLYFVRSGSIRLSVRRNGREVVLGTAGVGDTLGELAAVDGGPRTATARALETTTADYIPREALAASLATAPAAAARLIQVMAQRLRRTDPYVGELTNVHAAAPGRASAARRRRR
jgi:CRP-like cAMP-binding protein